MRKEKIVLGTRGSELARAQTRLVEKALRARWPELLVEIRIIQTSGDESGSTVPVATSGESQARRLRHYSDAGRKGIFTRAIEDALRRGEIDVAVHSAKDLPSDASDGVEICATLPRAPIDDALIFKETATLRSLRLDAIVATGSVRRQHQLRWKRPDLHFVDLRGNVPTRLRKLVACEWDAIILARAGLERLGHNLSADAFDFDGHSLHFELLPSSDFLPAGGQGIIAIQTRTGDTTVGDCVRAINHPETLSALCAEREFLRLLQADCDSPVGVLATIESQTMTLRAQVFEPSTIEPKTGMVQANLRNNEPAKIAASLHSMMYEQG